MRHHTALQRIIRQITLASLAGAPLAVACGGTTGADGAGPTGGDSGASVDGGGDGAVRTDAATDGGINPQGFDKTVCNGPNYESVSGLTPAAPLDYVELRQAWVNVGSDAGSPPTTVGKDGVACASATNKSKCAADLAALPSSEGWVRPSDGNAPQAVRYLVFTRGDSVGLVKTLDELATFLAPVDTAKDAALLVSERGYSFVCPSENAKQTPSGVELIARSGGTCGAGAHLDEHRIVVSATGVVTVAESKLIANGDPGCAIGRRPAGLLSPSEPCADDECEAGAFFAAAARLEAASIPAFEQLARDLAWHDAPSDLIEEALRARADEVRHARATRELARGFGASVEAPVVVIGAPRSLLAMALENAVEGCVRETFGALVASLQAERARDADVRETLSRIAEDETRHAALSWDVARWLESQLDADDLLAVAAAREAAKRELFESFATEAPETVQHVAGMPGRALSERAFEQLFAALAA